MKPNENGWFSEPADQVTKMTSKVSDQNGAWIRNGLARCWIRRVMNRGLNGGQKMLLPPELE